MPLAVYVGMEGNFNSGLTIAILLVIISFTLMIVVRFLSRKEGTHA
jgi:ABC-type sulfate transport system permease component